MKIKQVLGREIYDSLGYPTIECTLVLDDDSTVSASVPTGTSRSTFEAIELYDKNSKFGAGFGVQCALEALEKKIAPILKNQEPQVVTCDMAMVECDDTEEKSVLGANTMLAASIAVCKAQAKAEDIEIYELIAYLCGFETVALPVPLFNVINGGLHGHNDVSIQEFLLMPVGINSFSHALDLSAVAYHTLEKLLQESNRLVGVGPEGGFVDIKSDQEALELLMNTIATVKQELPGSFMIALDIAATHRFNPKTGLYSIAGDSYDTNELIDLYEQLSAQYPIYAIEDGIHENDWAGWQALAQRFKHRVHLIGDDIYATNPERIYHGIEHDITDSVLIKPNQIGTITETLQAIKLCKENGLNVIVSHRSRETNDTFIADLAVGVSASHIKAGACSRGERIAKYNRLLKIEQELLMSI